MNSRFRDKHALITGGAMSIGFEIARQFCSEGAMACIFDYNKEVLEKATRDLRGSGFQINPYFVNVSVRKQGVVLNMSSKNGLDGEFGHAHYNASKAGLILLTKTIALELAHPGIRANAVCPGYTGTAMNVQVDNDEFVREFVDSYVPANRVGKVTDIAPLFLFLASDDTA